MNSSVVREWNNRGVMLWLEGEQLKFRGRWDVLTDDVIEELRGQKPVLAEELKALEASKEERKAFVEWMEGMWMEASRPQWWEVLRDSLAEADIKRAQFAWKMLTEVLGEKR